MQQMVNCPSCSSPITVGQKFCGVCGLNLAGMMQQKPNACPTCGTQISPGQQFCGVCGTNLASLSQQQPQMAQQTQDVANISRGAPSMAATGVASAANATAVSAKKDSRKPRRYGILSTAATIFQIFGWIVLIFGIVSSVFIAIWPLLGGEVKSLIPGITFDTITVIGMAFCGIIASLLYGFGMLAFAEICYAAIDFRKSLAETK
jgi:predicted nucleic acid-binding Zn ribbon protein